jgi:hypothetical protein
MAFRVRCVCLACVVWVVTAAHAADDLVKEAVFEDCEKASHEFTTSTIEQQASLAEFFARVVALSTQSPAAPEAFAVPPGVAAGAESVGRVTAIGPDFLPGSLWQSLDAKRELKAKRCSLDLLSQAGGIAIGVLPALIETYSQEALSDEIAVKLEETVADIAEKAHRQGMTPDTTQFTAIAPHIFSERPVAAQIVFEEFVHNGMPYLVRHLSSHSSGPGFEALLEHVDPDRALPMQAWIAMNAQLSPDEGRAIAQRLPKPTKAVLPRFINDYIRFANSPVYGDLFALILADACLELGGFAIDPSQQEMLANTPLLFTSAIPPRGTQCLVGAAPTAAKRLVTMLSNHAEQDAALSILVPSIPLMPSDARLETYNRVKDIASTQTTQAVRALGILAHFSERKTESALVALSALKANPVSNKAPLQVALRSSAIKLLAIIGLGKEPNRFAEHLKPLLVQPDSPSDVLPLIADIPLLKVEVTKIALQIPPTDKSLYVLRALDSRSALFKQSVPTLIELLRFPDARPIVTTILCRLGTAVIPQVRKAASRVGWSGRMGALNTLIALKAASKMERQELVKLLSATKECSEVLSASESLCRLQKTATDETLLWDAGVSALRRCADSPVSDVLALCNPELLLDAGDTLVGPIERHKDPERMYGGLVEVLTNQPAINPRHIPLFLALLHSKSSPTAPQAEQIQGSPDNSSLHARLIEYLNRIPTQAPELIAALRVIAQQCPQESIECVRVLRALALAHDGEYDWSGFVRSAVRSAGAGQMQRDVLDVTGLLPADVVLAEVIPALESDNQEKVVGASLIGAALGPRAVPIISRLWNLRDHRSPRIRYTAVLALLRVNPLTPDLHDAVRKLLVNRFYPVAKQLPISWPETVAVVDMDRGTFGDARKARLERLMHATRPS